MRRTRIVTVITESEIPEGYTCDRCGTDTDESEIITVTIDVGEGIDGSRVDTLDFCNDCLVALAPLFVQVGSTAPLVTGVEIDPDTGKPAEPIDRGWPVQAMTTDPDTERLIGLGIVDRTVVACGDCGDGKALKPGSAACETCGATPA